MPRSSVFLVLAALLLGTALAAPAATMKGVTMEETLSVEGRTLALQGMGVRKKFIVSVYVGGLYLTTPSRDGVAATAADEPKRISLVFLRDVDGPTVTQAFREGFEANNSKDTLAAVKSRIDLFLSYFEGGVREDQRVDLTYLPEKGTTVSLGGKEAGVIAGVDFMRALWPVWLGPVPPSEDLKKGMLGLN